MKKSITKVWSAILGWILAAAVNSLADSAVQAVSLADLSIPTKGGGNNDSLGSVISADGRFVLFLSTASNLSTNDDGSGTFVDVFLRDRTNHTTTLVSVNLSGTGGGNGHSVSPVVSTDGRYVVFESEASDLVVNDTNGVSDVFLRDLQTGTTRLLSVNNSGTGAGNGASTSPVLSADGRYVVFVSAAGDLVANDTNGATDVFVHDLQSGTTTLASVRADGNTSGNGDSDSPALTPDGRWVAFSSKATNLVAGVTNNQGEIYVRDLVGGTTFWASVNSAAIMQTVTNGSGLPLRPFTSFNPVISADGTFVAFKTFSYASLLLRHNLQSGSTDLVSSNASGSAFFPNDASGPDMTPDGRFIAFTENSVTNGTYSAVCLWDAQGGTKTLVSANLSGTISLDTISDTPAVSADGRFVTFLSDAPDLAANSTDGSYQVFLRDTVSGTTQLISVDHRGGVSGETGGAIPTISADGRFIVFDSFDGGYVADDNNQAFDVFVRDTTAATTELISVANATARSLTANGISSVSTNAISADGRFVVFVSLADNLAVNDTNDYQDVFVRDLQTGTNILVSVNSAGSGSANGFSTRPVLSANGRYVAFISNAPDLTASKTNLINDIFIRDLQAGKTTLVSVSADGITSGNFWSSVPLQISSDGRYVAFYSAAKNLVPNDLTRGAEIFWRDIQSGLTVSVTTNGSASAQFYMSADGRYVASGTVPRSQYVVWDAQTRSNIYATPAAAFSSPFALSPDGRTLLTPSTNSLEHAIIAHDLTAGTDRVIGYSSGWPAAQVSGNGRFVTFVSAANAPNTPNGTNNIFLFDLQTATTTLVSVNRDRTTVGNGNSDSPSISADGRFVTYRSDASDLVAGDNNNQSDVFVFDRLTGVNTLVSLQQIGSGSGSGSSSSPVISADGSTIVFQSVASDLITGDHNGARDVFAFLLPTALPTDSDGDEMDDAWERTNFGDLTHDGSADSDGDGLSDLIESRIGTDPMNPTSKLRPQAAVSPGNGQVTITWKSTPGWSYRVQYKDNLDQPNWNDLDSGVVVSGSSATCWDTRSGTSNQRFYRISLVE